VHLAPPFTLVCTILINPYGNEMPSPPLFLEPLNHVGKLLQDTRVHISPLLSILVLCFGFYFQLFHCLHPFPLSSHINPLFFKAQLHLTL